MSSELEEEFILSNGIRMQKVIEVAALDMRRYDSAETALYKISRSISYPIEYILLEGHHIDDFVYTTVPRVISNFISAGRSLSDFYKEVSRKFPLLEWREIALFYLDAINKIGETVDQGVELKSKLANILAKEKESEMTKERKKEIENMRSAIENAEQINTDYNLILEPENVLIAINKMFDALRYDGEGVGDELKPIETKDALIIEYRIWRKDIRDKLTKQESIYEKIDLLQPELDRLNPVKYQEPVVDTVTYKFYPTIWDDVTKKGIRDLHHRPDIEEGIEIFRSAVVSNFIPYIQYNTDDGTNLYLILNDSNLHKVNPPSNYLDHISQSTRANTIYLLLWLGGEIKTNSSRNNLIKCIYYVDTSELILKAPKKGGGLAAMKANLEKALPLINLGKEEQIRVQGYFEVENVSINESSYHFMLNTDPLHKLYLYIEESNRALADKQRPNIRYRSPIKASEEGIVSASVTISFGQFTVENDDETFIPESIGPINPFNTTSSGKLKINVVNAESLETLKQFQEVFARLLTKYKMMKKDIELFINEIIPEFAIQSSSGNDLTTSEEINDKKKKGSTGGTESKNRTLRKLAPEIFPPGYARLCQCKMQPLLIKGNEVPEWRDFEITELGRKKKRQVMPFPPLEADEYGNFDDPLSLDPNDPRVKYWFVCPDNKTAFPALKAAKNLTNKDQFPYVPCCGHQDSLSISLIEYKEKDQKKAPEHIPAYYRYHTGQTNLHGAKRGKYNMTTMKILNPSGRKGNIGKILPQLLSVHLDIEEGRENYKRFGVPVGNNSLIHCVLFSIGDKGYIRLRNDEDRELYALQVRKHIANTMSPLLFKQELYDLTPEEIVAEIENPEIDFSSEKFYRGLEELFSVNIFVFDTGSTPEHPADTEEKMVIEIPRSNVCHIRPFRPERQTVLIIKHWGTEVDKIPHPHCELIISTGRSNDEEEEDEYETTSGRAKKKHKKEETNTFIFGTGMTETIYQTLHRSMQVFVWSYPEEKKDVVTSKELVPRTNPYPRIDWKYIFQNYNIVSQRVDTYGKLRTLGVEIKKDVVMTVFIPPSQPLDLPYLEIIKPVEEQLVLDIFGIPSGIAKDGLWYSVLDYIYGVFIPTIPGKRINIPEQKEGEEYIETIFDFTEVIPSERFKLQLKNDQEREITPGIPDSPSITKVETNYPIEKMRLAKRNMYFLIQIMYWLFLLDLNAFVEEEKRKEQEREKKEKEGKRVKEEKATEREFSIEEWWDKWVRSDEKVSNEIVEVIGLPNKFPKVGNTREGIAYMNKIWPNFFKVERSNRGEEVTRIRLYPKLEDKLRLFLIKREASSDLDRVNRLTRLSNMFLRGVYIWEMDFLKKKGKETERNSRTLIFLATNQLQLWIETQMRKRTVFGTQLPISRTADPSQIFESKPYIYIDDKTSKIFIIQNVHGGELGKVLHVCEKWKNTAKNIGYLATPIAIGDLPYVLYGFSPEERLVQIKDESLGDPDYHHILKYTKETDSIREGRYAAMLPIL